MAKQIFFVTTSPSLEEIKSNGLISCLVHFTIYPKDVLQKDHLLSEAVGALSLGGLVIIKHNVLIKDYDRLFDIISFMQENIKELNPLGELIYRKSHLDVIKSYFSVLDIMKIHR